MKIPSTHISDRMRAGKREGKKINLRRPKLSDASSIYALMNKKVTQHMGLPYPYKLKHAQDFVRRSLRDMKKGKSYDFGIELKQTKEIVGVIGLKNIDHENRSAEVGYWLGTKYWGQGIVKEALSLILDYGFKTLKLARIRATAKVGNIASIKLLKSAGFIEIESINDERCFERLPD